MAKNKVSEELSEYLRKLGKKGAKRRMETMTPEARSAVAKKAAAKSAEVRSANAKKKAVTNKKPAATKE
jgi:hypothetical protein